VRSPTSRIQVKTIKSKWDQLPVNVRFVQLTFRENSHGMKFHFITVQGRHLFKETTFTVSTLPRAWLEPPRSLRSRWRLKAHGSALSFVPPKTICYSRRTRKTATALHRTKKIDLYFRGVAAFRSNRRGSASNSRTIKPYIL